MKRCELYSWGGYFKVKTKKECFAVDWSSHFQTVPCTVLELKGFWIMLLSASATPAWPAPCWGHASSHSPGGSVWKLFPLAAMSVVSPTIWGRFLPSGYSVRYFFSLCCGWARGELLSPWILSLVGIHTQCPVWDAQCQILQLLPKKHHHAPGTCKGVMLTILKHFQPCTGHAAM